MKKIALHWQILIGMLGGILAGLLCLAFTGGQAFVVAWIKPMGTIFINLLKLIAIPLIIVALIKGISDLKDVTSLSTLGIKTFSLYILTTVIAVSIGLGVVNLVQPGNFISADTRQEMLHSYGETIGEQVQIAAQTQQSRGPLQVLVDIVPENMVHAMHSNSNMLQVIFFSLLLAVAMILLPLNRIQVFKAVLDSGYDIVLKIVDIMMMFAPYGVFALMASLVAEAPSADLFKALGMYALTVISGLLILVYGVYALLVYFFGKMSPRDFFRGVFAAQLLGFSTSSSAATLPVTMECGKQRLGIRKDVLSFVLPVGATINMDGTCLYQGVAAVFIAQVMGYDLTLAQQLSIVATATLASIGAAAVPGAGILMLVIVLESVGINPAGIALIFAVDRPLDMFRTATNVTGDSMVALLMDRVMGSKKGVH